MPISRIISCHPISASKWCTAWALSASSTNRRGLDSMDIIVPIHLEALRVSPSSGQTAKTALYDFTLLGSQPGSAMGDLIASNHFQTAMTKLAVEPGIHIHWSLPRAYTRGVQDETTGQVRYPVVPNRWLVIRYLEDN